LAIQAPREVARDLDPENVYLGGRALRAFVRPYARAVAGEPTSAARFDAERGVYELHFAHDNAVAEPTLIFVPALVQYADGYTVTVSDGHYERDAAPKAHGGYELLRYYHTKSLYRHSVVISRAISAAPTRGRDRRSSRI
tara:strand:- start:482 stop:901 length:420 start_codon:yes stop_codon:yes gene_type:complete